MNEILYTILYVVITFIIGTSLFMWLHYRRPKRAKKTSVGCGKHSEPVFVVEAADFVMPTCIGNNNMSIGYYDPNEPVEGAAVNSGVDWSNALIGNDRFGKPFKPTAYDADLPE